MKDYNHDNACQDDHGPCNCLQEPVRMNYFHGQLISERDLRTEQTYFREKLRHANRCLHGYGVNCGLEVHPVTPPDDCLPDDSARRKELRTEIANFDAEMAELKEKSSDAAADAETKEINKRIEAVAAEREKLREELDQLTHNRPDQDGDTCDEPAPLHHVRVTCGAAIDCDGNDVVLTRDRMVNVWGLLKPSERDKLEDGTDRSVYLSICYEECGREPTRPFAIDECATTNACEMARVAEGARITASLLLPQEDTRCDPCCTCCSDPCIVLAKIDVSKDEPITAEDIDHSVRRRFGLYDATVITGINWAHGATYTAQSVSGVLGTKDETGGIEITFSRPVHVSTVKDGTVEIWRKTGGRGLAGIITVIEGEFVDLPDDGMVDRIKYRDLTGETVQPKDQIMIIVRAPFLLDRCCRPVEGLHVGGRVPRLLLESETDEAARKEEAEAGLPDHTICTHPPHGPMPWTTSGPGNFESWFWVAEE